MKTIENYRDKMFVRVLDSAFNPNEETKSMIGDVFEVHSVHYDDVKFWVWNKDKSYSYPFNKSDLQISYPEFVIDGHVHRRYKKL